MCVCPSPCIYPLSTKKEGIREKIQNLLEHDYQGPYAIVVASDGSSDNTADIVRSFGDPRIVLHDFKRNHDERRGKPRTHARARGNDNARDPQQLPYVTVNAAQSCASPGGPWHSCLSPQTPISRRAFPAVTLPRAPMKR